MIMTDMERAEHKILLCIQIRLLATLSQSSDFNFFNAQFLKVILTSHFGCLILCVRIGPWKCKHKKCQNNVLFLNLLSCPKKNKYGLSPPEWSCMPFVFSQCSLWSPSSSSFLISAFRWLMFSLLAFSLSFSSVISWLVLFFAASIFSLVLCSSSPTADTRTQTHP